jgi:hypothetical protein
MAPLVRPEDRVRLELLFWLKGSPITWSKDSFPAAIRSEKLSV